MASFNLKKFMQKNPTWDKHIDDNLRDKPVAHELSESITEDQLDKDRHDNKGVTTEALLDNKREGNSEKITEKLLDDSKSKLYPHRNDETWTGDINKVEEQRVAKKSGSDFNDFEITVKTPKEHQHYNSKKANPGPDDLKLANMKINIKKADWGAGGYEFDDEGEVALDEPDLGLEDLDDRSPEDKFHGVFHPEEDDLTDYDLDSDDYMVNDEMIDELGATDPLDFFIEQDAGVSNHSGTDVNYHQLHFEPYDEAFEAEFGGPDGLNWDEVRTVALMKIKTLHPDAKLSSQNLDLSMEHEGVISYLLPVSHE